MSWFAGFDVERVLNKRLFTRLCCLLLEGEWMGLLKMQNVIEDLFLFVLMSWGVGVLLFVLVGWRVGGVGSRVG